MSHNIVPDTTTDLRLAVLHAWAHTSALRLKLARCASQRDEARLWAQAAVHRYWPDYLDTTNPPDWLTQPPRRRVPPRSPLPAALLRDELQACHEVAELLDDLARMLREFDDTRPADMDAVFYAQAFNMLLIEVRALLTILDPG